MTAAILLSASARLFRFSPSRQFFPSRHLQTLTLTSSSLAVSCFPRDPIAASAARSGVEESSSVEERVRGGGDGAASIELVPINDEVEFDRALAEAKQLEEPIVVLWMANWCRKCIYLKPKLEKLAVDYHPRIRFYCVDVNGVPQKLVTRAGITKMPTIQLWRDYQKQAEVIGGHKAWLVIDDIRRMIEGLIGNSEAFLRDGKYVEATASDDEFDNQL